MVGVLDINASTAAAAGTYPWLHHWWRAVLVVLHSTDWTSTDVSRPSSPYLGPGDFLTFSLQCMHSQLATADVTQIVLRSPKQPLSYVGNRDRW